MSDPKLNQEISDLKRANEELSLLNDIAHSIGLTFEFEGIVRTIIDKSIRSVGAEQGAIVLVDDEAGHGAHTLDRRIVTAGGPDELGLHPLIVGWMTLHHEPLNLSAPQNDERFKDPPWDQSIKSVACVPMLVQTTLIGILAVFNKQNAPSFSDDDVRLLGIIAASSAQVVENARLHGVEELHEKLKTFQTQLIRSKTMASLGALVAGLLHEINTPLGVIRSANDVSARCAAKIQEALAAGAVDDDARARITHFLKSIEENTEAIASAEGRVARIVSSLKSFAPLDGQESKREFDIHEGLENALTLLRYELPDDVRVLRDFGTVPHILCYPAEINQVFVHLLTNAVSAIDGPGTILVRTFQSDDEVHVQIADSGRGVSPGQLSRLFDPVFSSKGPRVKAGLGLFTSANIIDKHGGDIRVESEPGKGTTFTLVLPAAPKDR